jgi:hypothetical protein
VADAAVVVTAAEVAAADAADISSILSVVRCQWFVAKLILQRRAENGQRTSFYQGNRVAKNQNTFEKRRREMEKKQRAEEKRKRRQTKKMPGATPPTLRVVPPPDAEINEAM